MKRDFYFSLILVLISLTIFAQTSDNEELQKMFNEDQGSRSVSNINWKILSKQDSLREKRVYQLIKEGKIVTGKDYYNSAMIFQHGRDTLASMMAVQQMKRAIELDPKINKWLLAAAIDRDLMRRGRPQIYGTQYTKGNERGSQWKRYKIDSIKVTDEERRSYGVETLAEQKIKERSMNLLLVSTCYKKLNSIDNTIELIKSEFKKGSKSEYNVSENDINAFGYELMTDNKNEEALKVFKLNTELYSNGFNTFDSYGECLLKLNKRDEALKAYRKSLDLNPENDNARKILNEKK